MSMSNELAQLMEDNLFRVWSQRNESMRIKAMEKIYATESSLYCNVQYNSQRFRKAHVFPL